MKTALIWMLAAVCCVLTLTAEADEGPWRLDALRFAHSEGLLKSRLVEGAPKTARTDMGWYFFVARRGERTVLIDAGTDAFVAQTRRGRQRRRGWAIKEARGVVETLALIGVAPEQVTDVLITHHHWDHSGGLVHFPKATIHIHEREWRALKVAAEGEALRGALEAAERLGRVVRFDDKGAQVAPGIEAIVAGRHTRGFASVKIRCRGATHLIAGDSAYLFENIARGLAVTIATDSVGNVADLKRLGGEVSGAGLVLPGHDAALFERFGSDAEGVAAICPP